MTRRKETRNRRPKGLGSVFDSPPGSGKWYARPPRTRANPEPEKVAVANKEAGEALLISWWRDREDQIKGGQGRTVATWLAHWLDTEIDGKVNERSLARYRNLVERHTNPYLGHIALDKLEPADVRAWLATLRKTKITRGKGKSSPPRPLANDTIRSAFVRLKAALKMAVVDRLIRFNPCDGVRPPEMESREAYALTPQEAHRLLRAVEGEWYEGLIFIALATGMRLGELLGLRWSNVILTGDAPRIQIREQLQTCDGKRAFTTLKSKTSRRDIYLDADTIDALLAQQERVRLRRSDPEAAWPKVDQQLVFPSEVGTPYYPKNVLRSLRVALKRAGLPQIVRFHDLRHTAGSLMLAEGAQITDVSKILGHSSVAVTAKIYAHSFAENRRKAVASVARRLRRTGSD
jgi:integrase